MPRGRLVGTVHAKTIELTGPRVGEITVPHLIGALPQPHLVALGAVVGAVEETQLDPRRVLREDREVHAGPVPGGAERIRLSRPDSHAWSFAMSRSGIPTQSG